VIDGTFFCRCNDDRCNKIFVQKCHWKRHCRESHLGELNRSYACNKCDKKYKQNSALQLHIKIHHEGKIESWSCLYCGDQYARKHSLKRHHMKHHPQYQWMLDHL